MEEANREEKTSEQVNMNRNPTGKGGFKDNPQNRSDGTWDKTKVFSYQYRRFMNMSVEELEKYSTIPNSKRTVVEDLAYSAVIRAKKSLADVKEITDRTEGKAPMTIDANVTGGVNVALVRFLDEPTDD